MTLDILLPRARAAARPQVTGQVTGAMGLTLSVDGVVAAVGDLVEVAPGSGRPLLAEVVAVARDRLTCMPLGDLSGVHAGAPVRATGRPLQVPVGPGLLGRVLDGLGRPVDGGGPPGAGGPPGRPAHPHPPPPPRPPPRPPPPHPVPPPAPPAPPP